MEALEGGLSRVELELTAFQEGFWQFTKYTAFAPWLTALVSPALRTLLKVAPKAHPLLLA